MRKNSIISENITIWTIICQILGCFSYKITNKSNFIQNRFHYFDTFRCLLLYLGNEIYFSRFKAKYNYFGWILVAVDFFFTMIWLILFIKNNHRLISLYKLFDTFDNSFEQITKQNFSQKPFYKNKIVILILLLFVMDYFSMFYCVLYLRSDITYALTTAISRALQRSVIPLFLTGYLYLLYSVKIRFEMLQDMWTCNVEIKVNSNSKQFQMIKDLNDIKTLYVQLIGVVESMNLCFGSRLVIMFAQLFYFILLYFYMICTGLPVVVFLLPFYILLILIVTLCSQGLYESVSGRNSEVDLYEITAFSMFTHVQNISR